MRQLPILLLLTVLALSSCTENAANRSVPAASVRALGPYPGGHFDLQPDNSLRVLVGFNELDIDRDAVQLSSNYYGSRPLQIPDQEYPADRELLHGPEDWLATCRRDGYLEVWRDGEPDTGFSRIGEQYSPLPFWPDGQYRASDVCRLLADSIITSGREQTLRCFNYSGTDRWSFLMGAPARLLYMSQDDLIIAASDDGYLYALDSAGNLQWKLESGNHCAAILPDGKLAYIGRRGAVICVDNAGSELWRQEHDQLPDELRVCGGTIWYRLAGRLQGMDAEGQAIDCHWPSDLRVRDIVTGLNDEIFVVGVERGATDLLQSRSQQAAQTSPAAPPTISAQLICIDSQGNLLWLYDRLEQGFSLIPAHERQCWIIRLGTNTPEIRRIGLPLPSQGA